MSQIFPGRAAGVMLFFLVLAMLAACGDGGAPGSPAPDLSTDLLAARIAGVRLGDAADSVLLLHGEPPEQSGEPTEPYFTYHYPESGLEFIFTRRNKSVVRIHLDLMSEEPPAERGRFHPSSLTIDPESLSPFPLEATSPVRIYRFRDWKLEASLTPDERRFTRLALSSPDYRPARRAEIPPPPPPLATAPRPVHYHGAIWDPIGNRLVIIGGAPYGGPALSDCWSFDGEHWSQLSLQPPIPPRYGHCAVWDDASNRALVFGGYDMTNAYGDLWELADDRWRRLAPPGRTPEARWRHTAVWDTENGRMLVFGGTGASGDFLDELWSFDGSSWKESRPRGPRPKARAGHTAVWDEVGERMLVFGGADKEGFFDDLWSFSKGRWTELTPAGERPSPRQIHAAAWDPVNRRMLLFGGWSPALQNLGDFWIFENGRWRQVNDAAGADGMPPSRRSAILTWDRFNNRALLFSGLTRITSGDNDLWAFDGRTWKRIR